MSNSAKPQGQLSLDYRRTLISCSETEEAIAVQLAMLVDEADRQGQSKIADMFQQAGQLHRASSIKCRALAATLNVPD